MTNIAWPKNVKESPFSNFLLDDTDSSWLWLAVRFYVGFQYIAAGWYKVQDPNWFGSSAGSSLIKFIEQANHSGLNLDSRGIYALEAVHTGYMAILNNLILTSPAFWASAISIVQLLIGVAVVLGFFTGIAAFLGLFMNWNYFLAGTGNADPILFISAIGLVLSWKVCGYIGLDRFIIPLFPGTIRPGNLQRPV